MIIYIDENMSPVLAKGFNVLQGPLNLKLDISIEVRSLKEEFGEGSKDEDWIPVAGKQGSCIITQDYNINRIKHQRELCEQYELGMFYFKPPSKNGFSYWDMLKLMVKLWHDIIKISTKQKRPFAYKATSRGKLEEL